MRYREEELKNTIKHEQESSDAVINMLKDIQEQKDIIERSNREWISAFDGIKDAVMLHDKYNNIMRVNLSYKKLSGAKDFKDIIGKPYFKIFPKLDAPMKACKESIETGVEAHEEFWHKERLFRSRTYPVFDNNSNYSYGIHIFEDITKERTQEDRVKELNKTLKLISRCDEILIRSEIENDLISKISHEIIKQEEYHFVGVFFKENNLIMCNHNSSSNQLFPEINSMDFKKAYNKKCPIAVCIEDSKLIKINDIENDIKWGNTIKELVGTCPASKLEMVGSMLILPFSSANILGAMVIYSKYINNFTNEKTDLFIELSNDMAYGINTLRLRQQFFETSKERDETLTRLRESLNGTVESIAKMVEVRDPYTAGHQKRVSHLAVEIAKELNISPDKVEGIKIAALIHDIGKIQLPSEILTKPTKLTELEFEMIKTHSTTGYEILKNINFPWPIAQIIYQHHERIDGTGYPNGLKNTQILLEAKIISVADVVEAIASHRPYRASLGVDFALDIIEKDKDKAFDSEVVEACLRLFREKNYKLIDAN